MIGLATTADQVVGGAAVLPRVNLLPPEISEARRFRRVQAGLAGSAVLALVAVALLYVGATGSVADAQEQVDAATSRQQVLQSQTAQYSDVTATSTRTAAVKAMLVAAMGEEVRYSRLLDELSLTMPPGVWLTSAAFTQSPAAPAAPVLGTTPGIGTLTVTGVAGEIEGVALWLESLAGQEGYVDPVLQSSTRSRIGPRSVFDWSTTVTLSPDALSGRYLTPGS